MDSTIFYTSGPFWTKPMAQSKRSHANSYKSHFIALIVMYIYWYQLHHTMCEIWVIFGYFSLICMHTMQQFTTQWNIDVYKDDKAIIAINNHPIWWIRSSKEYVKHWFYRILILYHVVGDDIAIACFLCKYSRYRTIKIGFCDCIFTGKIF